MIEVKFKVWDKINKKIYPVVRMWFNQGVLQNVWVETSEGRISKRTLDNVILIRYTGLKDKNGIEIYEGDILRYEDGVPLCVVYSEQYCAWIIQTPDKKWWKFASMFSFDNTCLCHIVGNVYENPELLEEKSGNQGSI